MLKNILRSLNLAFIVLVLISFLLSAWTGYVYFSQPYKSIQITNIITDIYKSQKTFFIDIIDLTKLLIEDTSQVIDPDKNIIKDQDNLLNNIGIEDNPKLDESVFIEDFGDNPLGIVIKPSVETSEELDMTKDDFDIIEEEVFSSNLVPDKVSSD